MNIQERLPPVPDVLQPTSWKTAVVGAIMGLLAARITVLVLEPRFAVAATAILAAGSVWYLWTSGSLSETLGRGLLMFCVPVLLFPVDLYVLPVLAGNSQNVLVDFTAALLVGGVAVLISALLAVSALLLFRHD